MSKSKSNTKQSLAKRGVKGFFYVLFFPIFIPFKMGWEIIVRVGTLIHTLFVDGPNFFRENLGDAKSAFEGQKHRHEIPFGEIMKLWNIEGEEELPQKRKEITIHIGVFFLLMIGGLLQFYASGKNFYPLLMGALCFLPGLLGLLKSCWKLRVINQRKFVYFTDWLKGY